VKADPEMNDYSIMKKRNMSQLASRGKFHLCGVDKKILKKDQEVCEDDFIDNGFVVVEMNESLDGMKIDSLF